jgi:Kef-type K+ transport system membrane component KefB
VVTTVVAVIGKVGGCAMADRLVGQSWPNSLALGALLRTKGLMEVVVLAILLDAGVISANVFGELILMAVVTTVLAMPGARLMLRLRDARESARVLSPPYRCTGSTRP